MGRLLPTSPRSGRLLWRVCRLIALPIVLILASTCLVLRGQSLRALQPWAATGSSHPQRAALLDQDSALRTAEDTADSTDASLSTFSALRRVISDDLSRLSPTCGGLSMPLAGRDAAARDFAARPHVEDPHGAIEQQLATVAASAGAWRCPGARDVSLANCQQYRQLTAELGSLLRSYVSMQARMREGERADADGRCSSPHRDQGGSAMPAWARHSIVWYYSGRDTNGLGDSMKGMLSTVAASLLSPDPAPLYFAMQAAPDGSFPWVPSAAAGVDWRLPATAQDAIASAARRVETVIAMTTYPRYHLSRGTTELQLPACENLPGGASSGWSLSLREPPRGAANAEQLLASPSPSGSPAPPAKWHAATANVTVLHIGARNNLKRRAGELLMRPLLQEAEEQAHSMRLVHTNELSGAFVDLRDWPSGRCPAEWYHGMRPPMPGIDADARGSWNASDPHNGCLAHVPPEIRCYFLETEVRRLRAANESVLSPALLTARDAACSWCDGDRLHMWTLQTLTPDRAQVPRARSGTQASEHSTHCSRLWLRHQRLLCRRVLSAGRLDGPSVHVLLPRLLAPAPVAAPVPATPTTRGGNALAVAAAESAATRTGNGRAEKPTPKTNAPSTQRSGSQSDAVGAPRSVFQPGRQYVIGIHLRLGDEYFHRSGSAHLSSPTPAAADTAKMQLAAVRARRAASVAVHCARLAAAELVARYGQRDSVVWVISGDDPAGRDHLLRIARTAAELGIDVPSADGQTGDAASRHVPPVVAVVSLCNETLHVAKQHLAAGIVDTASHGGSLHSNASGVAPAETLQLTPTAALSRQFYDVYTEHALLSATHAIVKTHSGFSRTAALLGKVPLVFEILSSAWNVTGLMQNVQSAEAEAAKEWPPGACIDSNDSELKNKTS